MDDLGENPTIFGNTRMQLYEKKKGLYSSYVQPTKSVDDALHDLFDLSGNPTLEVASDLNGKIMHELVGLSQPPI